MSSDPFHNYNPPFAVDCCHQPVRVALDVALKVADFSEMIVGKSATTASPFDL